MRHRKAAGKLDQIAGDRWGMALTHSCWAACPFCPHVWTWRDAPSRPTIIESNALLTLSIRLSRDSGPKMIFSSAGAPRRTTSHADVSVSHISMTMR